MFNFALYSYKFYNDGENLFGSQGFCKTAHQKIAEYISNAYKSPSREMRLVKKSEGKPYPCLILRTDSGVTAMYISNYKYATIWQDFKPRKENNNPFSRVIIDNREGYNQIVIEYQGEGFGKNTDFIRDMLQDTFNGVLRQIGVRIEICAVVHEEDFYYLIEKRMFEGQYVKQFCFDVPNPSMIGPIENAQMRNGLLKAMMNTLKQSKMEKGCWAMDASNDTDYKAIKRNRFLKNMVTLCSNAGYCSGFGIDVRFRNGETYRFDDTTTTYKVIEKLQEKYFTDFTEAGLPFTDQESGIAVWLNNIKKKKHTNEKQVE